MHTVLVPDVRAAASGALNSARGAAAGLKQSTNEVLMVAPNAFGFNAQAAQDNTFMNVDGEEAGGGGRRWGEEQGGRGVRGLALIHKSEPTILKGVTRMPSTG